MNSNLWVAGSAMCTAIFRYLYTQYAKGLINGIPQVPKWDGTGDMKIYYETHWGTHRDIILSEVQRLAVEHGFRLDASVRARGVNRHTDFGVDDYVEVALHVWWEER